MSETVYISFTKNTEVNDRKVTLGKAASVWCSDNHILAKVKTIHLLDVPDVKSRRYVLSFMEIIKLVKTECENVEVTNVGETDFIISYKREKQKNHLVQFIKVFFVSILVFFGGTFSIMAYGNDVGLNSIFLDLLKFINAGGNKSLIIIQIAYCVGLTGGVIVFYNHMGKRKTKKDPTPLEIEMRSYEDEINTAIINESSREEKEIDVN